MMFLGAPSCDANGLPTAVGAGDVYGCCCPNALDGGPVNRCPIGNATLIKLQEVGTTVTMHSSDDPCNCLYRFSKGPIFEELQDSYKVHRDR